MCSFKVKTQQEIEQQSFLFNPFTLFLEGWVQFRAGAQQKKEMFTFFYPEAKKGAFQVAKGLESPAFSDGL